MLTSIDGVQFEACYPRKTVVHVDGIDLPIIHIDDFRANKLAAGRTRDLADLESLNEPPDPVKLP
ncbi:MAG: hypothetical protein ABL900_02640 [Burkholderiaceae bacterium]